VVEDRVSGAANRLRELEDAGATLDDILSGEVGRRWIEEDCTESPESPGPAHTPADAGEGRQTGFERPWWRRMFGG
jgi:hypothetical protein